MAEEAITVPAGDLPFDPMSLEFQSDPYRFYRQLREHAPALRGPQSVWMVTGYREAVEVLEDRRFALSDDYSCLAVGAPPAADAPAPFEGPRAFLAPQRGPEAAAAPDGAVLAARLAWERIARRDLVRRPRQMEPRILDLAGRLVDEALEAGRVDLMEAIARPLPLLVTSELLGVPADEPALSMERLRPLMRGMDPVFTLTAPEIDRRERASRALGEYFAGRAGELRRRPGDDLLSLLAAADAGAEGGERVEQEFGATCGLLFIAAFTTTAHFIGNALLALLRQPEELRRLQADPGLAPGAVEELLRFDAPAQLTIRTAQEDRVVAGQHVRRGEMVVVFTAAANRDPAVFPDPDRLDLTRPNGRRHLTFSHGAHACLGAPLARMQGRVLLRTLMRRARRLELDGEPVREPGLASRSLSSLPATLA